MRAIGACCAFAALTAVVMSPVPSAAFSLNLGPLHIGVPFFGFPRRIVHHRRRVALGRTERSGHRLYDKAVLGSAPSEQRVEPALLYPAAALPALYEEIFWPDRAGPWRFGYDALFRSAFAKSPLDDDPRVCQQPDRTAAIVARIAAEVRPRPAQSALLQKLGQALGVASASLMKACPKTIPAEPVARLSLMQSQIQTLSMAIDLIRPPLQQFEQSLDARQKQRFAAAGTHTTAAACNTPPAAIDWSIADIDRSVQPSRHQDSALAKLRQTLAGVAADLQAHCPNPLPPNPLARLQAVEARLDADWRATLSMRVALAGFEDGLSGPQKDRFEAMNLAQTR